MSVRFRDYYEVLGVDRDAGKDEIRKAFRKLARKFHPDVAEDKATAEEKFKELNEAYEVLSDPEKRETYDALGPGWEDGSDFAAPPGRDSDSGQAFHGAPGGGMRYEYHFDGSTGFSDFFESIFGARTAGDPFGAFRGFPGDSRRPDLPSRGGDIETDLLVTLEQVMTGAERQLRLRRPDPGGDGETSSTTIKVRIPKGITEGQLIRCAGLGGDGVGGGDPGDLFLRVRLERHPLFEARGSDLHMDLDLAPWESVLGTSVPIRTFHGAINMKIPPGTQSGTQLRIRGKGLPEHADRFGDLYIIARVRIPEELDADEKRLWEELSRGSRFRPRET